jgi:ketosteroid isomerase-like protein
MGNIMNKLNQLLTLLILLLISNFSIAQTWDAKQTEVWKIVLSSYDDINKGDADWSDKWVTKDAIVWGNSFPMPRNRDAIKRWDNYSFPQSKTLASQYSPVGIVVHGTTAVVHYYYSNGAKNKDGKQKTTHGRCSDILVKDDDSWKFVSWSCSDTPDKD